MREIHPNVQTVLDATRQLRHCIAEMRERVDAIVARRPSPSGLVIPEVDASGRLRRLYLAPGTCVRFSNTELAAEIMSAVTESAEDARRQYRISVDGRHSVWEPLEELKRKRRARAGVSPPSRSQDNGLETDGGKG